MNPFSLKESLGLAKASDNKGVVIIPPFVFLERIGKAIKKAELGAQDLFWEEKGAFTGEISVKQLKSVGTDYVLIGHSERRHKFDETDEMVSKKMSAAVKNNLSAILCVGETKQEKDSGRKEEILTMQLNIGLSQIFFGQRPQPKILIAYEPVWAIGSGIPETPESALKTILYIKSFVMNGYNYNPAVLYGGSVNSQNLESFIKYSDIDGVLVGGASIKKDEVKKMISLIKN
ncbi:MAG: triosephosphate isomerase (TIM) [Parcubacteria group bacterium Athens1014_26]|nr:MAG: triosephosphate isomerase (TIM) [Parcubacteria group bacterium Athens1014_26]